MECRNHIVQVLPVAGCTDSLILYPSRSPVPRPGQPVAAPSSDGAALGGRASSGSMAGRGGGGAAAAAARDVQWGGPPGRVAAGRGSQPGPQRLPNTVMDTRAGAVTL